MSALIRPDRRSFLKGLGLIIAAPAIVRASSIMPVKSYAPYLDLGGRSTYVSYPVDASYNGLRLGDWVEFTGLDQYGQPKKEMCFVTEFNETSVLLTTATGRTAVFRA
jgi:hypothetical protein